MSRLWLVRHGATTWSGVRFCGRSDPELSAAGRVEADRVAARLGALVPPGTDILTSPLRRARETAERIAPAVGGRIVVDERLREVDVGAVDGLTFEAIAERWPELAARLLAADQEIDWPGGETAAQLRARAGPIAQELRGAAGDRIVVSHGGIIAVIRALVVASQVTGPVALRTGGHVVVDLPTPCSRHRPRRYG